MHRNPYASLAASEPRFQRPVREGSRSEGGSGSGTGAGLGFKRSDVGSGSGSSTGSGMGFKRSDVGSGSGTGSSTGSGMGLGFKRSDVGSGSGSSTGSGLGFKRSEGGSGSGAGTGPGSGMGFKRSAVPVFQSTSESAFPPLGPDNKKRVPKAPIWVAGQDTAKVIERALLVKTPPAAAAPRVPDFLPLEASYSSSDEDDYIPSFEAYQDGGGWDD